MFCHIALLAVWRNIQPVSEPGKNLIEGLRTFTQREKAHGYDQFEMPALQANYQRL